MKVGVVVCCAVLVGALALPSGAVGAPRAHRVLRVGSFHGRPGQFRSIQSAIDAARPGDWVLVGPGDFHERGDLSRRPRDEAGAGVLITTPGIHLRGMDRNRVVVDGTRSGAARCSRRKRDQATGPRDRKGKPLGRNGIEVLEADGVTVENLTACNFLEGAGGGGNQIWFNGGDGSGRIGMGRYAGRYLSATSTFYANAKAPAASYGIFVSNAAGPGRIERSYGSNMNDAAFYVGACRDCNAVLARVHAQFSVLGYSGTNSGGHLVLENSEWDHNQAGIVTNSQNNDDAPSPQLGSCPHSVRSCTVFRANFVHDNNNPDVPAAGTAALGPVGTGIVVAGGRYDTLLRNRIEGNGAWGVLLVPYPDDAEPPPIAHCQGGVPGGNGFRCFFDDWGNRVLSNRFAHNGFFANPTNGDLGEISGAHSIGNCYARNSDAAGLTSTPAVVETTAGACGAPNAGEPLTSALTAQVICATQLLGSCPPAPGRSYPRTTRVRMPALRRQATIPDPCRSVPANPWCPARRPHLAG